MNGVMLQFSHHNVIDICRLAHLSEHSFHDPKLATLRSQDLRPFLNALILMNTDFLRRFYSSLNKSGKVFDLIPIIVVNM